MTTRDGPVQTVVFMSRLMRGLLVVAIIVSGLVCPVIAAEAHACGCADEPNGSSACSDWMVCACCSARTVSPEPEPPVDPAQKPSPGLPDFVTSRLTPSLDVFHPPRP